MSGTFTHPNMKTLRAGVLMPLVFLVLGCFQERWEGYVYPNKQDLTQHIFVGEYSTLESCRAGALAKLHQLNTLSSGDYECGKNCRSESGLTIRVCEETLR